MLRVVTAVAVLTLGANIALAQNTAVVKQRQDLMKGLGGALKDPTTMVKGEAPFDLAKVKASLKALQDNAVKLKSLWPEDSKTGDTKALPVVWTATDFLSGFDGLAKDAKAAETSITDEASFKAAWPKVVGNCGGCHKVYRAPPK
jgi:cytochrome c556